MKDANNVAIEVRGLAKRFGEVQTVAEVDFDVYPGELFGFLGAFRIALFMASLHNIRRCWIV